jgi:hypothetical protein
MQYVHKPTIIEAEQWQPDTVIPGVTYVWAGAARAPVILTQGGSMMVRPGDYIVTGIKGEKYPVKPEIFETIYEELYTGQDLLEENTRAWISFPMPEVRAGPIGHPRHA